VQLYSISILRSSAATNLQLIPLFGAKLLPLQIGISCPNMMQTDAAPYGVFPHLGTRTPADTLGHPSGLGSSVDAPEFASQRLFDFRRPPLAIRNAADVRRIDGKVLRNPRENSLMTPMKI
jgi:hypothetical protein